MIITPFNILIIIDNVDPTDLKPRIQKLDISYDIIQFNVKKPRNSLHLDGTLK